MEERIKAHEKFMRETVERGRVSDEVLSYHRWTVANFQHERIVHLIVMLTFVVLTLGMVGLACWLSFVFDWWLVWPMDLVAVILVGISIGYVKHYYFLENHIQGLYDVVPRPGDKKDK